MHLRSGDLKGWRADSQDPSRISLLSTPITNHGSGRHVDLRKCAYPLANGSEACPSFRTPRSFNRAICLSDDKFTTLRNTLDWFRSMNASLPLQSPTRFCQSFPLWLRWSSICTLLVSLGFLSLSFFAYGRQSIFSENLIPTLLVTLSFAAFLNIYSLWHFRNEHREIDQAFRDTDCEFSSIFRNVLDGILIADDAGDCLDANPAAAAILRCSRNNLIGQSVGRFLVDMDSFRQGWNSFLQNKHQRGRARLVAGDGTTLYVDFTAAANYLRGRHLLILCDVTERAHAEFSLRKSEERFQQMASNIQEIFWMMDANTQEVTYVNEAYATLTGHSLGSLRANPSSCRELIHSEDRIRVLSKLQDLANSGILDEEFRFIRADGEVRWAWAKSFPIRANEVTRWLVGTVQDITSRKQAEMQITEHLDAAEAARAEAEALRKSTLALSQNLAMDSVLDTLLQCMSEMVPFDVATVLFVEDASNLMVAREVPRVVPKRSGLTFKASDNVFLERVLFERRAILVEDVSRETEWRGIQPRDRIESWLGVPLLAAGVILGILSLGAQAPNVFTPEHLRLAKSLAVAAAVAIKNARVHERAEIYAAELEVNLRELRETQKALEHAEHKFPRSTAI
jgi:PAS domain S-box-containing protein